MLIFSLACLVVEGKWDGGLFRFVFILGVKYFSGFFRRVGRGFENFRGG